MRLFICTDKTDEVLLETLTDALDGYRMTIDIDRIIGSVLLVPLPGVDGTLTSNLEIGWHFRQASWGYGFATEAAQCVARHALAHLPELYAVAMPDNHRSIKVMQRLGMTDLGITHQYHGGQPLVLFRLRAAAASQP